MTMCILNFVGANGETYFNKAALIYCVQNFPKSRGPVLGILNGFPGLSGAILTRLYLRESCQHLELSGPCRRWLCLRENCQYECLVEGCGAKLMNYKSRQQHLIDKHKFPASFEFKKANPSKKHRQKFLHKKGSVKAFSAANMQVEEDSMITLVSAVSRLSTSDSPTSISFSRRHTRGFAFVPRAVEKERRQPSRSPAQTTLD